MTRYDVRLLQETRSASAEAAGRWLSLGGAVIFESVAAYSVARNLGTGDSPVGFAFTGLFGLLGVVFAVSFWMRQPPAAFVEIDDGGIRFISVRGHVRRYDWDDRRFKLRLAQTDGAPDARSLGRPMQGLWEAKGAYKLFSLSKRSTKSFEPRSVESWSLVALQTFRPAGRDLR